MGFFSSVVGALTGGGDNSGIGNKGPSTSTSSQTTTTDSNNYTYTDSSKTDASTNATSNNGDAVTGNKSVTDASTNIDARSVTDSRDQSTTYVDRSTNISTDQGIVSATGRVLEETIKTLGRQLETGFVAQTDTIGLVGKATVAGSQIVGDTAQRAIDAANKTASTAISGANDSQSSALSFASGVVDKLSSLAGKVVSSIQSTADASVANSAGVALDATRGLSAVKGDTNARAGTSNPVFIAAAVIAGIVAIVYIWKRK